MAKSKSVYVCTVCGYESSKWNGKCVSCGEWNTFEEREIQPDVKSKSKISAVSTVGLRDLSGEIENLSGVDINDEIRYFTGIGELDRVLGGGLVKGSLVLLGGEPGIGKSTLLLQICQHLGEEHTVLYISGEESIRQIKLRAERLKVDTENLFLLSTNDARAVSDTIIAKKPDIAIIDSIQTMALAEVNSSAGSITQVRECTTLFMQTSKQEEIPIFVVSHVNKDGAIAGPKVMEHIVDAVLYFEGERNLTYRLLRAVKNRFGSTNEIGVFTMGDKGLEEVANPSEMLLSGRPVGASGCCVSCVMEGTRPILAEVQALVTKSGFATPKRTATGFDYNRLAMIIAVLEKRTGLFFGTLDVFLNIVGGFKLDETAGDLSVAIALYSGYLDLPIDEKIIAFGEIGLGGEVRNATSIAQRINEAERLGFTHCIIPKQSMRFIDKEKTKIKITGVSSVKQAFYIVKNAE